MTSSRASVRHLSPNEEAYIRHSQLEERRKARLVQVREQEKRLARQLREKVKSKREVERRVLKEHVDAVLADAHEAELRELEEKYLYRVGSVGQGHRDAQHVNEEENRLQELRLLLEAKQRWRAQDRHAAAMKELSANQLKEKQMREHSVQCKQQALQAEKKRAQQMATAHPPTNQMIVMDFDARKGRRVHFKEAEGYASSYYHIPNPVVERLGTPDAEQPTGQKMAELQTKENQRIEKSAAALQQEHHEKARLRYKHAIAKVKLEKERDEMLVELQSLEREDRASRQKSLGKMPPNMFQPTHRRIEMASEQQREMEGAFERLFVRRQQVPAPVVCGPTEDTASSLSITEQSSTESSDQPDHDSPQSERIMVHSPKITPDSGVHIDSTISTEGSPQLEHTVDVDSGLTSGGTSLTANRSGLPHASYSQEGILTSSTDSSADQSHPLSHSMQAPAPRPAWPRATGTSQDTFSSTDSEQIPTRAASTQTQRAGGYLVRPGIVLERPELTVTDVTSSDDQSSVDGRRDTGKKATGAARGEEKKPPLSTKSKRSEGMKTLLSMIQSQHEAWNDRLKKRDHLLRPSTSPDTEAKGSHTLDNQADSLSIFTLSTRESTLSPTAQTERAQQPSPHSDLSTSPEQLSISQYHTTIDTSAQAPRAQTPPLLSATSHTPSSHTTLSSPPFISHASQATSHPPQPYAPQVTLHTPLPSVATSPHPPATSQPPQPLFTPSSQHVPASGLTEHLIASPGLSKSAPNHSIPHPLAEHTQRYDVPYSTSTNTPHYTQVQGHDSTEDTQRFPPLSHTIEPSIPHTTTGVSPLSASYHTVSTATAPPSTLASTALTGPSLDYLTATSPGTRNLLETSLRPSVNNSQEKLDSFLALPEQTVPQTHFSSTDQTSLTPAVSIESSSLPTGRPTDFVPLPMDRREVVSSPKEALRQTEDPNLSQRSADQLSILTLDTTQFSLTDNSPHKSTPVSTSFRSTVPSTHHEVSTHPPFPSQASSVTAQPPVTLHTPLPSVATSLSPQQPATHHSDHTTTSVQLSSPQPVYEFSGGAKELSILDTIEESGTEVVTTVNSDSFQGDRMQDEPHLSIDGLDTDFSHSQHTRYAEPPIVATTAYSPPPAKLNEGVLAREERKHSEQFESPRVEATTAKDVDTSALPVSGLSLQEAFLRRKQEFVRKSQQRLEQIKVNIEEQKAHQVKTSSVYSKHSTPVVSGSKLKQTKGVDSGFETGVGKKSQTKQRVVTFSSPLLQKECSTGTSSTADKGPPRWLFSKEKAKIQKKEMRDRNERFYQKLPEVRKRAEEEKRKEAYNANREKARDYQENIRSKMKTKRVVKKTQPTLVMPTTKLKTKPPFK